MLKSRAPIFTKNAARQATRRKEGWRKFLLEVCQKSDRKRTFATKILIVSFEYFFALILSTNYFDVLLSYLRVPPVISTEIVIDLHFPSPPYCYCFQLVNSVHFEPWMANFLEWLHWNVYSNLTCSCPFNLYVGLLHHFGHSEWFRIKDEKNVLSWPCQYRVKYN